MKKIITSIILAMVIVSSIFLVGCNIEKTKRNVIDPDADASTKINLNIILPYVSDGFKENKLVNVINGITGYNTTYDQFPTTGADNNLTGIITDKKRDYNALKLTKAQFDKYAVQAAAFADLTDVVNSPKFATIKNAISADAWESVTYDGKILGIPDSASNNNIDGAIIINTKVLKEVTGSEDVPTTLAEFKDALKKFKNVKGGNTAFTVPSNTAVVKQIAASVGFEQSWQDINGELVFAAENPNLSKYVAEMNSLKSDGLLDTAMQTNIFSTCASQFAQEKSLATVANFWEMQTIYDQLKTAYKNENLNIEDYVAFIPAFEDENGEMKAWQSSGVSYATVIPNWMANTGIHVMNYIQEKLKDDNFTKIVAGDLNVHYTFNEITNEYEPLPLLADERVSTGHFLTGTNDSLYKVYWTQLSIKANANYYYNWLNSNTRAFRQGMKGVTNPTKTAPPFTKFSSTAASIENTFNTNIIKMIYGSDSSVTIDSIKAQYNSENKDAIKEVKDWYNNKK